MPKYSSRESRMAVIRASAAVLASYSGKHVGDLLRDIDENPYLFFDCMMTAKRKSPKAIDALVSTIHNIENSAYRAALLKEWKDYGIGDEYLRRFNEYPPSATSTDLFSDAAEKLLKSERFMRFLIVHVIGKDKWESIRKKTSLKE